MASTSMQLGKNPYVLAVGCLRSGTTLLQRMLDGHPQLAVAYDSHFIPGPVKKMAVGSDPPLTPELIDSVRSHRRFPRLNLPDAAVDRAAADAPTYSAFVSALYTEYARLRGKPLAGEKSPGYCRHLPRLHALLPWVKTIHLIRDGRDIALSVLDWGKGPARLDLWQEEPVATCALWWRRDVSRGTRDGADLGPERYYEVRYEALVGRPEETLRGIAGFLQLPYAPEMLTVFEGKTRSASSAKAAWLPPTPGLRDWRRNMAERDVELFEAIAGDLLSELGYERAVKTISPSIATVAERCCRWWDANMESGGGRPLGINGRAERASQSSLPFGSTARISVPDASDKSDAPPSRAVGPNPYVFIVGCPRSGTTLLKRMVDAHSQIAITPETHWIPRHFKRRGSVTSDGLVTAELLDTLLEYHKFRNLKLSREDLEEVTRSAKPLSYARFVSAIFDLYGERQGKTLVGDKTPGYVQHLDTLHALWPSARVVHLIRDGRDVCLSMLEWNRARRTVGRYRIWEEDPVSTTALWWERLVRLGREDAASLGSDLCYEIRYESLVANPAEQCAALCSFLSVPADEGMLRFHEDRVRIDSGLSAKKAFLPPTTGLRDWQSQMQPEDVERFEAAVGDLLDELGYPRACPRPRERFMAHAAEMREAFRGDPRNRKRRHPSETSESRAQP